VQQLNEDPLSDMISLRPFPQSPAVIRPWLHQNTSPGKRLATQALANPLIPSGTGVARFIDQQQWAKSALQLQHHLHDAVQQNSEPLKPQPTVHSAEGMLSITSPSAEIIVTSHAGEHIVRCVLPVRSSSTSSSCLQ
jgi:hypothetical protein